MIFLENVTSCLHDLLKFMQTTEASPTSSATIELPSEELVGLREENSQLRQETAGQWSMSAIGGA